MDVLAKQPGQSDVRMSAGVTEERIERELREVAHEGLLHALRFFRGGLDRTDPTNRLMLTTGANFVGTWARNKATNNATEQARLIRAKMLADGIDV